jgi:DNA recombination protein RmuC
LRNPDARLAQLETSLATLERNQEKTERTIQAELAKNREEAAFSSQEGRKEISDSLKTFGELFLGRMGEFATFQKNQLDFYSTQLTNLTQSNDYSGKMLETVEHKTNILQEGQ